MKQALWQWLERLWRSLAVPAPETAHHLQRIRIVERDLLLLVKAVAIGMLVFSFRISPWFSLGLSSLEVVWESAQYILAVYTGLNLIYAVLLLSMDSVPYSVIRWCVFAMNLVDAIVIAVLALVTGGFNSILFWLFVGLIMRNAASIPAAWSQVVLNLGVVFCYVMAGLLEVAVRQSVPDEFRSGPRSTLFVEAEIRSPAEFASQLQQGAIPVAHWLWEKFTPEAQRQLEDLDLAPQLCRAQLVSAVNRVVQAGPVYDPARFIGISLRAKTRNLLEQQVAGEPLFHLNRLLLEDAFPLTFTRNQTPRQLVEAESDAENPTEPLLIRVMVLLLVMVCCYGAQALLEKQQLVVEEAREFSARESQLRSAGRLAAEFAHQIKNPLAIINNAAFSLQRELKTGKGNPQLQLGIIQEEVERADQIITQVMGYAELTEGRVEKLDLVVEIERAIIQVLPTGIGLAITVQRELRGPFPPMLMQRRHLAEIFINLLQNAREALGGKGRITISACSRRDLAVEIVVADDGPGIPPTKLDQVFEAYFTTKQRGTGLGLAIVKNNAELYGGSVRVESELGKGVRFTVVFPAKSSLKPYP